MCCEKSHGSCEHEEKHGAWENGPVRMHNCWACSGQEEWVDEPGLGTKAKIAIEDANVVAGLGFAMNRIHQLLQLSFAAVFVFVVVLSQGAFVDAVPTQSGNGSNTTATVVAVAAFAGACFMFRNSQKAVANDVPQLTSEDREVPYGPEKLRLLAQIMSQALQFKTVSYDAVNPDGDKTDLNEFKKLHDFLVKQFPNLHNSPFVKRKVVNGYSLIYEWEGENVDLPPVMLCAHLDVVPTPNAEKWKQVPFGGVIDDEGTVWGRGAIDNKHNVLMQLQAVEDMIADGVEQPPRTIFLAYGHDEEIGGEDGAQHIAKEMKERLGDEKLSFILDEGPFIIKNIIPGVKRGVGLIGNVEKGSACVKLTVDVIPPGHSSMPPKESNVGILSNAIARLEARPLPADIKQYVKNLYYLGKELPLWLRFVIGNLWMFGPLLKAAVLKKPAVAASCRTTTAVTITRAGTKINVIPGVAEAWVNHRIHPMDKSAEKVVEMDRKIVNDPRVKVDLNKDKSFGYIPPSPESSPTSAQFKYLQTRLVKVYNAPSIPSLMVGNTDTKWYWDLTDNIFRHTPVVFECLDDVKMFHGFDERITSKQLGFLLHFYRTFITDLKGLKA